jgi:hypothetical protein
MCYRLAVFPPSHVSTCNGQRRSQIFWVRYNSYSTRKGLGSLSLYTIALRSSLPPTCLLVTANEAHRYFASIIIRIVQGKDWVLSPYVLSPCGLLLHPTCLLVTANEARRYFGSIIIRIVQGKDWVLSPYVLSPCGLPSLPRVYM